MGSLPPGVPRLKLAARDYIDNQLGPRQHPQQREEQVEHHAAQIFHPEQERTAAERRRIDKQRRNTIGIWKLKEPSTIARGLLNRNIGILSVVYYVNMGTNGIS